MKRLLLPAVVAVALVPASAAHAQWSAPQTMSAPHTFLGPLQLQPGPFASYPWQDGTSFPSGVGASIVGPAGERPAPLGLSGTGRYGATRVMALAQDPVTGSQRSRIRVAFGSVDGGFGTPRTIATGANVGRVQLSVAPDGRALAAWIDSAPSGGARLRVSYRPVGGRFGRPSTIIGSGHPTLFAAALGAGNDFSVVAVRDGVVVARTRPRGGSWRPMQTLARPRGRTFWDLRVAVDSTGHTQAVWRRRTRSLNTRSLEAASASRGHRFGSVQTLVPDGAGQPVVAATSAGWVVAQPFSPQTFGVAQPRIHIRQNGRRFGTPIDARTPVNGLRSVAFAVNADRMALAWIVPSPTNSVSGHCEAAIRPLDGPFGPVEQVSPDEAASDIQVVPQGGGFAAAWVARPDTPPPGTPIEQVRTVLRESTHP